MFKCQRKMVSTSEEWGTGRVTHVGSKVHGEVCSREAGEEREASRYERHVYPYCVGEIVLTLEEQEGEQGGD